MFTEITALDLRYYTRQESTQRVDEGGRGLDPSRRLIDRTNYFCSVKTTKFLIYGWQTDCVNIHILRSPLQYSFFIGLSC